jgi:hypothetical protein
VQRDGTHRILERIAQRDRATTARNQQAPFAGVDIIGMPADLATAETNAFRRISPVRNRWPELAEIDARVADLEQRSASCSAELADLYDRRAAAPGADSDRMAAWQLDGQKGPRPVPQAESIDTEIVQRQADLDGIAVAIGQVLAEKAAYVEKHRARLVKEADKAVETAHTRQRELIEELARTREGLAELRQSALWAATFPDPAASQTAQPELLAGGLRKPVEDAIGITTQVNVARLWDALRADADLLKDAATPAQRALLEGRDGRKPAGTTWFDTEEGAAQRKQDQTAARERYEREWGQLPSW